MSRLPENQKTHDAVVKDRAEAWRSTTGVTDVWTNPNGENTTSLGEPPQYPDIIIEKDDKLVIEEVETSDSVTENESKQWEEYSKLGFRFNLLVPRWYGNEAKKIISARGISNIYLVEYWYENLKLHWTMPELVKLPVTAWY